MALMVEHQLILVPAITQDSAHLTTPLTQHQHFQRKAFVSTRITPGTEGTHILALKTNEQKKIKPKIPTKSPKKVNGSVLKRFTFLSQTVIPRTIILMKSSKSWHKQRNLMDQLNLEYCGIFSSDLPLWFANGDLSLHGASHPVAGV